MSDSLAQAKAYFLVGVQEFETNRFNEALHSFESARQLAPDRPTILANLGMTQYRLGLFPEALATLNKALERDPNQSDALVAHGLSNEALGQWGAAISSLEQALALGQLQAGSWLALAHCRSRMDLVPEALTAYEEAIALDPTLAQAWSERGSLLRDLGQFEQAALCFEKALACGADEALHRFYLAAVSNQTAPLEPPAQYVQALFDQYAGEFDTHLVAQLQYVAHKTLLAPLVDSQKHFSLVLDLGCGTGLCGQIIKQQAAQIEGVDLAAAMVEKARATGVYESVLQSDLLAFLQSSETPADLIMAADVFIYVGALEEVFSAVSKRLTSSGCFAFSLEKANTGDDMRLRSSLRYAHSLAYVERLAAKHKLHIVNYFEAPLRHDQGQPVMGLYCYLQPGLRAIAN